MTQTTATNYLADLLKDGRAVNMVQVYQSRTGRKRGYRLFTTNHLQRVQDVTAEVCKAIGQEWDHKRGTYETIDPAFYGDSVTLSYRLTEALGVDLIPISTL